MVEIIRNKWCDDLEDLLQCPICFVRPTSWIHQCIAGHHICENCKCQMSVCPTCRRGWSETRNLVAESLCSKLDDIKLSLIDPEGEINKLLLPDRASIATQTDETLAGATAAPPPKKKADDHTGPYPCRIGACGVNVYYAPLVKHIKTDHSTQYLEFPKEDTPVFLNIWLIDYVEQMTFDRAFEVGGMGTFFLKLASDVFGNFSGAVLMLHNGFVAKQFSYQLEISCCQDHTCVSYTGEICSCRTPENIVQAKSLHVPRTDMVRMKSHEKQLKCTVLVGRKPQTEETQEPVPNNQHQKNKKKNRPKNHANDNGGMGRNAAPRQEGQATGASNFHGNDTRMPRPRTAPNGQAPPLMAFPPPNRPMYRPPPMRPMDHPPPNRSMRRPPPDRIDHPTPAYRRQQLSEASSVTSLPSLYPDLRDSW